MRIAFILILLALSIGVPRGTGRVVQAADASQADGMLAQNECSSELLVPAHGSGMEVHTSVEDVPTNGTYWVHLPIVLACQDLITNGGFEDDGGWEIPVTEYTASYTTSNYYTGDRSMRTGIVKTSHNKLSYSTFHQKVSIPEDSTATLTAYLYRMSEEPDATNIAPPPNWYGADLGDGSLPEGFPLPSGDVQYVLILNEDQEWIESLIWQRKDAHEWTKKVFDLSKYGGQTIWIHFGTYNDGSDGVTSLHVDDVSLVICP